jgi:hypothetical protein
MDEWNPDVRSKSADLFARLPSFFRLTRLRLAWIARFAIEIYSTSIAFWRQPTTKRSRNILLTVTSFTIVLFARNTHAAYDHVGHSVLTLGALSGTSALLAFFACGCDPKCRGTSYLSNSNECYRVLTLGTLLSALFLCTNHIASWAEGASLNFHLQEDDFQEKFWILALPATIVSFSVLFGNSLFDPTFREIIAGTASQRDWIRLSIWSLFFLGSFLVLNLVMFSFERSSVLWGIG